MLEILHGKSSRYEYTSSRVRIKSFRYSIFNPWCEYFLESSGVNLTLCWWFGIHKPLLSLTDSDFFNSNVDSEFTVGLFFKIFELVVTSTWLVFGGTFVDLLFICMDDWTTSWHFRLYSFNVVVVVTFTRKKERKLWVE